MAASCCWALRKCNWPRRLVGLKEIKHVDPKAFPHGIPAETVPGLLHIGNISGGLHDDGRVQKKLPPAHSPHGRVQKVAFYFHKALLQVQAFALQAAAYQNSGSHRHNVLAAATRWGLCGPVAETGIVTIPAPFGAGIKNRHCDSGGVWSIFQSPTQAKPVAEGVFGWT